jgi:lipoprotein-releasing system permease protein
MIDSVKAYMEKNFGGQIASQKEYVTKQVIVHHAGRREGIMLRGVGPDYFQGRGFIHAVNGRLEPRYDSAIVLGRSLARKLFVQPGDRVTIFALTNPGLPSNNNPPIIEQFTAAGFYESGIAQFDDDVAYVTINAARRAFGFRKGQSNGLEVKFSRVDNLDSVTAVIKADMKFPFYPYNIFQLHPQIFTWIELQQKPIPIVLALIIIVAAFNVISVTLMVVLEKSSAIGILRTLGIGRKSLGAVFLLQGLYLGALGTAAGNLLAYLLCKIQLSYNVITLPSSVYFTSIVPIQLSADIFLFVSGVGILLSLTVSFIPAYVASRFPPLSTIRFH